ncbi:MAG TPA: carbohydrate ABC transporter permease [Bacilli bacterium]
MTVLRGKNWAKTLWTALFFIMSMMFLTPLLWMISASTKLEQDVMKFPIQWIPETWNLANNYQKVWMSDVSFTLFYWNSLKVALICTVLTLFFSSLAGYSFAKLKFRAKSGAFLILMMFMVIPEQSTLVPRYILIKWLGLYNTHAALILMGMFSIYFTFLMRQFMMGIHNDLLEAGKMDGAGYFYTFFKIVLPLSRPILATVGIIKFIWVWNDYQNPLIFLYSKPLYTIPIGIQYFKEEYSDNVAVMMMASVSAIIPLLVVFIVLQKHVIKGISLGGVKG